MKYCKISIQKTVSEGATQFAYPLGYDTRDHEIVLYEDPYAGSSRPSGNPTVEFAISLVPDDYGFPRGTIEMTEAEAEALMDEWINGDRSALGLLTAEDKAVHRDKRKGMGRESAAVAATMAEARQKPLPGPAKRTFNP